MNIPLLEILSRLSIQAMAPLAILGASLIYFLVRNKPEGLMFFLTIAAAFIGSSFILIADMASLARWIIIVLLPLPGLIFGIRMKVSVGPLLFWGYVLCGFVSLLNSRMLMWQMQRGVLLLLVALAIPLTYGNRGFPTYRASLSAIALGASLFSIVNFTALPGNLMSSSRFSGYSSAAPNFTLTLAALLPFTYWGFWKGNSKAIRWFCAAGFLLGTMMLIFSGQRAGTVGGLLSLLPLVWATVRVKKPAIVAGWAILLVSAMFVIGYLVYSWSSADRINFLLSRYSINAGISNRDLIWDQAFREIGTSPILGYGIGAAETLISSSFHNTFLEVWFNAGILGLFFYISAELYFLCRIFTLDNKHRDPETRADLALALGYMLGFIVLGLFESVGTQASGLNLILYVFLGTLVSNDVLFKRVLPAAVSVRDVSPVQSDATILDQTS